MHRTTLPLAGLAGAAALFVFGGPVERLLIALFLGLPAVFCLPLYAALWLAYQITGDPKYKP